MTTHLSTGPFVGPVDVFVDVTSAQIAAPTPDLIADIDATYRLNVPPYTRYQSNGTALVTASSAAVAAYLAALPADDAGLNSGDLFWNGGFLCQKV